MPSSTRVSVSEENEELFIVSRGKAKYYVAFNHLDGSANIDYNVSVRTICRVYKRKPRSSGTVNDLCVCAGYVAYGSAVELVFTFQGGDVHGFCLDSTIEELFTHVKRWFSPKTETKKIYSANKGNAVHWDNPI